ncbi:MAG: hypothetical protein IT165_10545 [Bryobacterales bacterium]|nr:hypothetical protein [Bryobacterales bacterium]
MKITVEISDELFRRANKHCAERGISFRELVERGLRLELDRPKTTGCFRLKPFGFAGEGQQQRDWAALRELIYQERGGAPDSGDRTGGSPG